MDYVVTLFHAEMHVDDHGSHEIHDDLVGTWGVEPLYSVAVRRV